MTQKEISRSGDNPPPLTYSYDTLRDHIMDFICNRRAYLHRATGSGDMSLSRAIKERVSAPMSSIQAVLDNLLADGTITYSLDSPVPMLTAELVKVPIEEVQRKMAGSDQPTQASDSPNADHIIKVCDGIKSLLLEKNAAYGDSALNPSRIFSKSDPQEQIKVRIDDKLNRIMKGKKYPGDNDVLDLVGYLVLLLIAQGTFTK